MPELLDVLNVGPKNLQLLDKIYWLRFFLTATIIIYILVIKCEGFAIITINCADHFTGGCP